MEEKTAYPQNVVNYILTGVHITKTHISEKFPWEWCFLGVPIGTENAQISIEHGVLMQQPDEKGYQNKRYCKLGAIRWIFENRPDLVAAARNDELENIRYSGVHNARH